MRNLLFGFFSFRKLLKTKEERKLQKEKEKNFSFPCFLDIKLKLTKEIDLSKTEIFCF